MNSLLFPRFLIVGVVNTMVGLSTMYILFHSGFSYWISTFIGNFVGACVSYFLNKTFTFRSVQSIQQTFYRFFIVICICYFVAYFISRRLALHLFQQMASFPLIYAEDLAILLGTILYTILNFIGQKKFVFSKRKSQPGT